MYPLMDRNKSTIQTSELWKQLNYRKPQVLTSQHNQKKKSTEWKSKALLFTSAQPEQEPLDQIILDEPQEVRL